jgi:hypothetical protein
VRAIKLSNDRTTVYAGGDFTRIGGQPRAILAALPAASATPTAWSPYWKLDPAHPQLIYDICLSPDGSRLYAAVAGHAIYGGNRGYAFAPGTVATPGRNQPLWWSRGDGDHNACGATPSYVFFGGHFDWYVDGARKIRRHKIYAVRAGDGRLVDWDPGFNSVTGVFAITPTRDSLLVGGSFTKPRKGFAQFR